MIILANDNKYIEVNNQLSHIVNSDIESNPYLKVFLEADESLLPNTEKINLEKKFYVK